MANTAPTNFGKDTSCLTALRTGRFATGARLVAEAAYRRLSTPRGTLSGGDDEANYGLDLADLIGSVSTPSAAAALPDQIQAELLKDERISAVTATVASTKTGPSVSWTISIEGTTAAGPFSLVLSVAEVTVTIIGVTPGA